MNLIGESLRQSLSIPKALNRGVIVVECVGVGAVSPGDKGAVLGCCVAGPSVEGRGCVRARLAVRMHVVGKHIARDRSRGIFINAVKVIDRIGQIVGDFNVNNRRIRCRAILICRRQRESICLCTGTVCGRRCELIGISAFTR